MMNLEPSVGADVYASRIGRTLNSGFVALMISVGHRTRLFDTMASLPPSTSAQIAGAARLTERYVREWLASMTAARVIHYDFRTNTYFLPIEYAVVLTRAAAADNLAPAAQMLALLANVEDHVVAAFHAGGGVAPDAYDRLQALVAEEKRVLLDDDYLESLLELMPGLDLRLAAGATVLDAGCGDGALLMALARKFPRSAFRGYDSSAAMIDRGNERVDESGLQNVELCVGDVASMEEPRSYDLIFAMEAIHEMAFPGLVLRNLHEALRREGVFVMQEIAASTHLPRNTENRYAPMLYALSLMHAVPVALGQEGEALGRMWGEERARQMLIDAGFTRIRFASIAKDAMRCYCIARK